jgi:hypothetical protein
MRDVKRAEKGGASRRRVGAMEENEYKERKIERK